VGANSTQLDIPANSLGLDTGWLMSEIPLQRPLTDKTLALINGANRLLPNTLHRSTASLAEFIIAVGGVRYTGVLTQPLTVKIPYSDAINPGFVDGTSPPVPVDTLRLYTLNEGTGQWEMVPGSTVDKVLKMVTGQVFHLSIFSAIGLGSVSGLSTVRVYPVPYRPNGNDLNEGRPYSAGDPLSGIIFDNLPDSVTIKIYTVSGRPVASLSSQSSGGKLRWDVRNADARDVASGGYIAVVSSPGVKSITKKVLIIR